MPNLQYYNPQRTAILGKFSKTAGLVPEATGRKWLIPPKPRAVTPPLIEEPAIPEETIPEKPLEPIYESDGTGGDTMEGPTDNLERDESQYVGFDDLKTGLYAGALGAGTALTAGAPVVPALAYGVATGAKAELTNRAAKGLYNAAKAGLGFGTQPMESPTPGYESSHFGSDAETENTAPVEPAPAIESIAGYDAPHFGSELTADVDKGPAFAGFGSIEGGTETNAAATGAHGNPDMDLADAGAFGGSDSGGSDDKVLCAELYHQGYLPKAWYEADEKYANTVERDIIDGYQTWAIPFTRLMKRYKILIFIAYPFVMCWAKHMAFKMKVEDRDSRIGAILESFGKPICRKIYQIKRIFK